MDKSAGKVRGWRRIVKWAGMGLLTLLFLKLLVIFVVVPLFGGSIISGQVSKRIAGELSVERIWINPFRFSVTVSEARLRSPDGEEVVAINRLMANVDPVGSLFGGEYRAQALVLDGARIDLLVDAAGNMSLMEAVAMEAPAQPRAEAEPEAPSEPQPIPRAWLGLLDVSGVVIHIRDESRAEVFDKTIDPIAFSMENIRTAPEAENAYQFLAKTVAEERILVEGVFQLDPIAVSGQLDVSGVRLSDYSIFVEDVADFALQDGLIDLEAGYEVVVGDAGIEANLSAGQILLNQLVLKMTGQQTAQARLEALSLGGIEVAASIPTEGDLGIAASVDCRLSGFEAQLEGDERPFAAFSELLIEAIEFEMMPMSLRIPEVRLVDPVVLADRDAEGNLAVVSLFGGPAAVADTEEEVAEAVEMVEEEVEASEPGFDLEIGKVSLVNGDVRFRDASVTPMADLHIHPLNVTVEPVSLNAERASTVEVSAIFEEAGEILLSSQLHLMDPSIQTTADLDISGVPLTTFAPYSAQFIGQPVEEGTFKGAFEYKIEDNQLTAGNVLTIERIRFGNVVAGYDGATYPVGTAIAVLENNRGEIVLDVPVSGDLDDPSFQPTKVVLDMLTGLIFKAMTAPLNIATNLTGSMVSGLAGIATGGGGNDGPDYSRVAFTTGATTLGDGEAERVLPVVADMLKSRPKLVLSIQGSVDPEGDIDALKRELLENRLAEAAGDSREAKVRQVYATVIEGHPTARAFIPTEEEAEEMEAEDEASGAAESELAASEAASAKPSEPSDDETVVEPTTAPAGPRPGFYLGGGEGAEPARVARSFYNQGSQRTLPLREVVRAAPKRPVEREPASESAEASADVETEGDGEVAVSEPATGREVAAEASMEGSGVPSLAEMEAAVKERLYTDAALGNLARTRAEAVARSLMEGYGVAEGRIEVRQTFMRNGSAALFELETAPLD